MATEELQPRSQALREALNKEKEYKLDDQMLLNVNEACQRLGISRWSLYRQINGGKLTSVKIGSRRLISSRAVADFIRQSEDEAQAQGGEYGT
jgi:excisionase family DNA binding protein